MNVLALVVAASPLFASLEPLEITLRGPVRDLSAKAVERPFTVSYGEHRLEVKLSPRGKSRLKYCEFPPLRMRFETAAGTIFAHQDKLKLVTHCDNTKSGEANVLEEYLAYRILNVLTPASFRARLLRITYEDDKTNRRSTKWGFAIEDIDALASRLGGRHIEPKAIARRDLDTEHATLVNLFQYLIGNADYSLLAAPRGEACCHNAKLVEHASGIHAIPYDFDMTGLVNPQYPNINTISGRRGLRARSYRGFCVADETLEAALATLEAKETEIKALVTSLPDLRGRRQRVAANYIDRFFKEIAKPKRGNFGKRCR